MRSPIAQLLTVPSLAVDASGGTKYFKLASVTPYQLIPHFQDSRTAQSLAEN